LLGATVINFTGVAIGLWLGASPVFTSALGAFVVLTALYFVSVYILRPGRLAASMKRNLDPAVRLRVDSEGVLAIVGKGQMLVEWSRVKSVLELESCFLLVLSPFSYLVVPKSGLPQEPAVVLRGRVTNQWSDA
jgi:hypothetical protein